MRAERSAGLELVWGSPDIATDRKRAGARRLRGFIVRTSQGKRFGYARSDTEAA